MQVGIVGAGILGLAISRRLQESAPGVEITVLDKEDRVAAHQTSHNSGVAHAGVNYPQGSLKAELCRRGIGLLKDYCADHGVAYDECGKLIVARDASELTRLDEIERRARGNGVPGLRLARRHWRTGAWELHGSLSRREFVARARSFIPELTADTSSLAIAEYVCKQIELVGAK